MELRGEGPALTTVDPTEGYKGRSYRAASVRAMADEFTSAIAKPPKEQSGAATVHRGGWTNADLVDAIGGGNMRSRATFDAVREYTESKNVETFNEAIVALARSAKNDWRKFPIEVLRECPGFESAQLPEWLHDAANAEAEQAELERFYENQRGTDAEDFNPDAEPDDEGGGEGGDGVPF